MAVVKLEITGRSPLAGGRAFGEIGPYTFVQGTAHFAVDPLHQRNAAITDIKSGLVTGITGGLAGWTLPFAATRADRAATGDPRPAIEERYASRQDYLDRVRVAAQALVEAGHVLAEDVPRIEAGEAERYDAFRLAAVQ